MDQQKPVRIKIEQHRDEHAKLYAPIPVEDLLAAEQEHETKAPEEMSAIELLEGIERDEMLIRQEIQKTQQGIESLLLKLNELQGNPVEQRLDRFVEHTLKIHKGRAAVQQPHFQVLLQSLEEYTLQLIDQQQQIQQREAICGQVADELIESNRLLLREIDDLLLHLQNSDSSDSSLKRVA